MKKYRIQITTRDTFLTIQDQDGNVQPQLYTKIQYKNDLDKAIKWAREYVRKVREMRCVAYVKTEIKEYEFVKDIKVDF